MKKVLIIGLSDNYRRAGLVFGTEPTEVDLDDLDEGVVKAIEGDKNLTIKHLPVGEDCQACAKCQEDLDAANGRITELEGELDAAKKRIAELEAGQPDGEGDKGGGDDSEAKAAETKPAKKTTARRSANSSGK